MEILLTAGKLISIVTTTLPSLCISLYRLCYFWCMENNVNITLDYYEKLKNDSIKLSEYEKGGLVISNHEDWQYSRLIAFAMDESKVSDYLKGLIKEINKPDCSIKIKELEKEILRLNHIISMNDLSFKEIKSKWWFKLFKNF